MSPGRANSASAKLSWPRRLQREAYCWVPWDEDVEAGEETGCPLVCELGGLLFAEPVVPIGELGGVGGGGTDAPPCASPVVPVRGAGLVPGGPP